MAAPSCTIEEVVDAFDPTAFDRAFGDALLKCGGDAKKFLTCALGFLKRKSNFFKGTDAQARLLEAYKEVRSCMHACDMRVHAPTSPTRTCPPRPCAHA